MYAVLLNDLNTVAHIMLPREFLKLQEPYLLVNHKMIIVLLMLRTNMSIT